MYMSKEHFYSVDLRLMLLRVTLNGKKQTQHTLVILFLKMDFHLTCPRCPGVLLLG